MELLLLLNFFQTVQKEDNILYVSEIISDGWILFVRSAAVPFEAPILRLLIKSITLNILPALLVLLYSVLKIRITSMMAKFIAITITLLDLQSNVRVAKQLF